MTTTNSMRIRMASDFKDMYTDRRRHIKGKRFVNLLYKSIFDEPFNIDKSSGDIIEFIAAISKKEDLDFKSVIYKIAEDFDQKMTESADPFFVGLFFNSIMSTIISHVSFTTIKAVCTPEDYVWIKEFCRNFNIKVYSYSGSHLHDFVDLIKYLMELFVEFCQFYVVYTLPLYKKEIDMVTISEFFSGKRSKLDIEDCDIYKDELFVVAYTVLVFYSKSNNYDDLGSVFYKFYNLRGIYNSMTNNTNPISVINNSIDINDIEPKTVDVISYDSEVPKVPTIDNTSEKKISKKEIEDFLFS